MSSYFLPFSLLSTRCKQIMDELCPPSEGKSIRSDVEIYINVRVKYCSNLDILDLPGFVTANSQNNLQDIMAETRDLGKLITFYSYYIMYIIAFFFY